MPPTTAATTTVSLRELADLAIGTPEVGAVNFTALHTLIVAMLRSLNLQEVRIDFQSPLPSPETSRTLEIPQAALSAPQLAASREKPRGSLTKPPTAAATLESQVKGLGGQVQDLSRKLKTVTSQVQGIVSHVQHLTAPISELDARDWLEEETAKLTPARARAGSLKTAKAFQRIDALEKIVRERDEFLDLVGRKMSLMPVGEEVTMVTWEELEQAITDGWRASLGGSETTTGLPQRRGHASATSDDILQGGVPIKRSSADRAVDSPRAYGSDQTFSGLGGVRNPSEGVTREQGRGASAAAFPAREQHPRAREEAGLTKTHHPSASQSRVESDRPRTRELPSHSSAHLRKEEREAQPGPTLQDLSSGPVAGDEHQGHPDQHWGVDASPGQIQPGPDQHGLGPHGVDPLVWHHPRTYPRAVVPHGVGQLGVMPPGMDEWGLVTPGPDQYGMVPPEVPGTHQQGWELPSPVQPGMVPPGAYQYDARLPGTAQQPGVDPRGLVPLAADQRGFLIPGVDQQGLVLPGMDQQGLVPHLTHQRGLASSGLMQVVADRQGFVQPSLETSEFTHPDTDQHDIIQPGPDQHGLVPAGAGQRGLVQPGADRHGLVQTLIDPSGLVQPGAELPRGLLQPGTGQPGSAQPGMDQRGLVQPGAGQPGSAQPGMDQRGLVQPGAGQPGLAQPGMDQRGLLQPGTGQPGLAQPGMDQHGLVQPGAGQPGLAQSGMDHRGLVQPGAGQPGLTQPGMDQRGLVQPGAGQPGLVQPILDQRDLVQPGAGQHGLAQPRVDQRGLVQPGASQPGMVLPRMDQGGLVQPGTGQPGLVQPVLDQRGLVQPGAGQPGLVRPGIVQPALVQPGAGQGGLVQPGTDQLGLGHRGVDQRGLVQAGTDPRGFSQPGAYPPGLIQPGAYPPDLVQPGAYPRGLVQPGAYLQGLGQSSAYPRALIQPGTYPHGFMQPSTDQRGLVQPEIDQYGLRQPGTGQPGVIPAGTGLRGFPAFAPDFPRYLAHPYHPGEIPPGRYQHGQVSALLANQGLASPGIGQKGLSETYQQGLLHRGTDQHGLTPLSPHVGSVQRAQQHLVSPGPDQRGQGQAGTEQQDQVSSIPESWDPSYPGPPRPGVLGVDPRVQMALDPKQIDASGQPAFPRSADSLSYLHGVSSEKSDSQSERRDSLDKLAPTFPMAVETFRLMGELLGLYVELKENMKELDEEQAGQTDLEKIQYLLGLMVKKAIPPDLQEQLNTLKSLTKEVRQEKAKMERMQKILEGNGEHGTGKDMKNGSLSLQLGILRVTVADIEKELAELRESQEQGKVSMEHSVSEASLYLQDQLDKLRAIIENMLASSSTLLSLSMAPHKTLSTLEPGQIDPEATCPACSLDLSHQVSTLVQRYEQLQDMVNNLAASRPSKKAKLQSQDEELLGHVQSAILQVQGDCEKLYITTSGLIEDRRQKQKDIDVLYQGIEKLEKEKANREHLEMEIDVKADKSALAAKVSRVQFDATTEQLNHMMQELVAKMSDHEQDWQKMLDKLLVEMDSKLDRLELDPVKKLLEDRWKSLRQQLKERSPLYQADEAAAMRRQLLAHFHCLSCDRPLETAVTGQFIPVTPVGPALPGHRSTRPYTIFELEQVRQQSRNLKLGGTAFPRGDLAHMERSVGRLRTMHSKMLMDIEKVQIHFGGSVRASSQMIRELLQAQCLSSPCYKRVPETADYVYSSVPRRCGGSHTLTYPYRRSRLQHLSQGLYPTEEVQIAMKHDEVDILGLDGHIYKGRMDTRLPGILTKDSECPRGPETPQVPCSGVPRGLPSSWKAMGPLDPGCLLLLLSRFQTLSKPQVSVGRSGTAV
uniref:Glutamine rich 2 n=1 Tax=Neovison vison TaxID=452646 RepID=A0A8C7B227_NEOVI